ncbi:MAG: winged helix DNA-binding domain-containing protein [Bacteroidota bacterium]
MKDDDLARLRLRNHRLSGGAFESPQHVVQALGAAQAQEFAVAKWSLGRRARGATNADVDRALSDGAILRTHVLRPTWHFVLPADLRWMVALTAPRVRAAMAPYDRKLGLTDAVFGKGHAAIAKALAGGRALPRTELAVALGRAGVEATGPRLGLLLMRAELDLLICSGARQGKHHTYALVEERVPPTPPLDRDEALAALTERYFRGHGPATLKDFAWWSGLAAADIKRGISMVGSRLVKLTVGDRTFYLGDVATRPRKPTSPAALLLQGYDEYIIGYRDTRWLPSATAEKHAGVLPRGQVMYTHAVVVDGQVMGHWRRGPGANDALVEAFFTRPLVAAQKKAISAEVRRYGRFLGESVRLDVTAAPAW